MTGISAEPVAVREGLDQVVAERPAHPGDPGVQGGPGMHRRAAVPCGLGEHIPGDDVVRRQKQASQELRQRAPAEFDRLAVPGHRLVAV